MSKIMEKSEMPLLGTPRRGKVRDNYDLGENLLIVTTDRISAFDEIMPNCIPQKGMVLNQMAKIWFGLTQDIVPNHMVSTDPFRYSVFCPRYASAFATYEFDLIGRSTLAVKAETIPIECVVRGYLSGSGWKSYQKNQTVCGLKLPLGLKESDRLPEPIFTPSTKEETGHDINISFDETCDRVGHPIAEKLRDLSLSLYKRGAQLALNEGIIIADTKFEFGIHDGDIILIDEVLTPDSSRFWPAATYKPGGPQASLDKQYLRDYLEELDWNKKAPAPHLPEEVIQTTRYKYLQILKSLQSISR